MSKKIKCVVSWSGGKDSALALNSLLKNDEVEALVLKFIDAKFDHIASVKA